MNAQNLFGYTCPECGKGLVEATKFQNYKTKIKGYPFIVPEAIIGVCDHCNTRHFSAKETKQWETLYYRSLEEQDMFLSAEEITDIRNQIGLSMEDFARLIGCTRQSIYNWEKKERNTPPSRMADLLMKLVRESYTKNQVDVISLLLNETNRLGFSIELKRGLIS